MQSISEMLVIKSDDDSVTFEFTATCKLTKEFTNAATATVNNNEGILIEHK